jgi:hypothetical protein
LTTSQKAQIEQLKSAAKGMETARLKMRELGIQTLDLRTGKMLPLGTIIDELHRKVGNVGVGMAAARLQALGLGAGANMLAPLVVAGAGALDKATAAATRQGSAAQAAARQQHTLRGEFRVLGAEVSNFETNLGTTLIPILIKVGHVFFDVTNFVLTHRWALISLATVVGGLLSVVMGVFVVNKMRAFVESFKLAKTAVMDLIGKLPFLGSTATASAAETEAAMTSTAATSETTAATVTAAQTEEQVAMERTAAVATTTAAEVDTAMATERGAGGLGLGGGLGGVAGGGAAAGRGLFGSRIGAGFLGGGGLGGLLGTEVGAGMGAGAIATGVVAAPLAGYAGYRIGQSMLRSNFMGLATGVNAASGFFGHLFGAIGSGNVNLSDLSPSARRFYETHGGWAGIHRMQMHRDAVDAAAQKRQETIVARISGVLSGQDVLPRDVRIVQGEGLGRDIGTMAGMQIGSILQRYLQETGGKVTAKDIAPLIQELHIHGGQLAANDIVRELSWAVRTGHISRRPIEHHGLHAPPVTATTTPRHR